MPYDPFDERGLSPFDKLRLAQQPQAQEPYSQPRQTTPKSAKEVPGGFSINPVLRRLEQQHYAQGQTADKEAQKALKAQNRALNSEAITIENRALAALRDQERTARTAASGAEKAIKTGETIDSLRRLSVEEKQSLAQGQDVEGLKTKAIDAMPFLKEGGTGAKVPDIGNLTREAARLEKEKVDTLAATEVQKRQVEEARRQRIEANAKGIPWNERRMNAAKPEETPANPWQSPQAVPAIDTTKPAAPKSTWNTPRPSQATPISSYPPEQQAEMKAREATVNAGVPTPQEPEDGPPEAGALPMDLDAMAADLERRGAELQAKAAPVEAARQKLLTTPVTATSPTPATLPDGTQVDFKAAKEYQTIAEANAGLEQEQAKYNADVEAFNAARTAAQEKQIAERKAAIDAMPKGVRERVTALDDVHAIASKQAVAQFGEGTPQSQAALAALDEAHKRMLPQAIAEATQERQTILAKSWQPIADPNGNELGRFRMGKDGDRTVASIRLPQKDGSSVETALDIEPPTDAEVAAEAKKTSDLIVKRQGVLAQARALEANGLAGGFKKALEITGKAGASVGLPDWAQKWVYGKVGLEAAAPNSVQDLEQEVASLMQRQQALQSNGKAVVLSDRVTDALKKSDVAGKVGTGLIDGAIEDFTRGFHGFVAGTMIAGNDAQVLLGLDDTKERDQWREHMRNLPKYDPGSTGAAFRGGAAGFAREAVEGLGGMTPQIITMLVGGAAGKVGGTAVANMLAEGNALTTASLGSMGVMSYGQSVEQILSQAGNLREQAKAAEQGGDKDTAKNLNDRAEWVEKYFRQLAVVQAAGEVVSEFILPEEKLLLPGRLRGALVDALPKSAKDSLAKIMSSRSGAFAADMGGSFLEGVAAEVLQAPVNQMIGQPTTPGQVLEAGAMEAAAGAPLVGVGALFGHHAEKGMNDIAQRAASDAEIAGNERYAVLRAIAQGAPVSALTPTQLNAIGLDRPQGSSKIVPRKPQKGEAPITPDVHVDEKGRAVILQPALDAMEQEAPATRSLVGLSAAERQAQIAAEDAAAAAPPVSPAQPTASSAANAPSPAADAAGPLPGGTSGQAPAAPPKGAGSAQGGVAASPAATPPAQVSTPAAPTAQIVPQGTNIPATPRWAAETPDGSTVTVQAPDLLSGHAALLATGRFPQGLAHDDVSPITVPTVPAVQAPAPAPDITTLPPHEQIIERGKAIVQAAPDQASAIKSAKALKVISQAVKAHEDKFDSVIVADGDPAGEAGISMRILDAAGNEVFVNDPDLLTRADAGEKFTYHLRVGVANLAQVVQRNEPGWMQRAIMEEARHRVLVQLWLTDKAFRDKCGEFWSTVTPEMKRMSNDIYRFQTGAAMPASAENARLHEMLRQMWEGKDDGKITEQAVKHPSIKQALKDLMTEFVRALRDMLTTATGPTAKAARDILAKAEAFLKQLESTEQVPPQQAAPVTPAAAPAPPQTIKPKVKGSMIERGFIHSGKFKIPVIINPAFPATGKRPVFVAYHDNGQTALIGFGGPESARKAYRDQTGQTENTLAPHDEAAFSQKLKTGAFEVVEQAPAPVAAPMPQEATPAAPTTVPIPEGVKTKQVEDGEMLQFYTGNRRNAIWVYRQDYENPAKTRLRAFNDDRSRANFDGDGNNIIHRANLRTEPPKPYVIFDADGVEIGKRYNMMLAETFALKLAQEGKSVGGFAKQGDEFPPTLFKTVTPEGRAKIEAFAGLPSSKEPAQPEPVAPVTPEVTAQDANKPAAQEARDVLDGVDEKAMASPLMQQWLAIRKQLNPDTILVFRLGDFYETFAGDAKHVAKDAGATLTKRNGIPMAGYPVHAQDRYVKALMAAGWKVAVAETVADAVAGKIPTTYPAAPEGTPTSAEVIKGAADVSTGKTKPAKSKAVEAVIPQQNAAPKDEADAALADAFKGLFAANPAPLTQSGLPEDRDAAMLKAARALVKAGTRTPQQLAERLDRLAPGGQLRQYSQAFWDFLGIVDPALRGTHDWNAIYQEDTEQNTTPTVQPTDETQPPVRGEREDEGQAPAGEGQPSGEQDGNLDAEPVVTGVPEDAGSTGGSGNQQGIRPRPKRKRSGRSKGDVVAEGLLGVPSDSGTGNDTVQPGDGESVVEPGHTPGRSNYHLSDPESIVGGGPRARFEKNREAIRTYETLTLEQRDPTPEELDKLAAYTGWGSFGQELFNGSWEHPDPKPEWQEQDQWLRDNLGKEAWESAQASIINAHYTDPPTVSAMWDMVRAMGFTGGRVLEPSMGIGNFYSLMPRDLMGASTLTGIELDTMTARIAKMMHPQANVQQKGYQDSQTADNFYDLVIGNWPFAKDGPADRRFNHLNLSLHDYFFAKALAQTRPGGIVIGITSSGTMDKKSPVARKYLASQGELVAAFRLPSGAFEKYAGTKVVTDIIILRKREEPLKNVDGEEWINSTKDPAGKDFFYNEYYQKHPENVLGQIGFGSGTTFGRAGMIVDRPEDIMDRLKALPYHVPKAFKPWDSGAKPIRHIANTTTVTRQNALVEHDGDLHLVEGEQLRPLHDVRAWKLSDAKKTAKRLEEARAIMRMRDAFDALMLAYKGTGETDAARAALRKEYDAFVKKFGHPAESDMLRLLDKEGEPSAASLMNLEEKQGTKYVPRAILTKDIMRRSPTSAKGNIQDAYALHRNNTLHFDLAEVAKMAGVSESEAEKALLKLGQIYRTPLGAWEPRDIYLSGNVRQKLREARDAQDQGQDMARNIEALEAIQPADTAYFEIEVQMGAAWVTKSDYQDYIAHLLNTDPANVELTKSQSGWNVTIKGNTDSQEARNVWGVPQVHPSAMFRAAMNATSLRVTYEDSEGRVHLDTEATEAANGKVEAIREELPNWLWSDPARTARLTAEYNEAMNAVVTPQRDGSHLRLEGLALALGDNEFSFRQHQQDAVWRGVLDGRGMFAHEVGTGKTFTMAGIAMEGRRLGVLRKPMLFAHNANHQSVAADFRKAYPSARILHIEDLSPSKRDAALRQIALDEWDAIIVPHSLIDRFSLRKETMMDLARKEIESMENEIYAAAEEIGISLHGVDLSDDEAVKAAIGRTAGGHTAKNLVKARNRIIQRIEKKAQDNMRESAVFFEDLGVDAVMVDEAHIFKKIGLATRKNVKGLNKDESGRGFALGLLTDYLKLQNGGKGVFLFTGTPVTNTLNEVYNMMRFVMDDAMASAGVRTFDDWFNNFATTLTDVELTSGGTHEPVERLLGFINVPELARMAGQHFDVVQARNMPEFKPRESADGLTENPVGRPFKQTVPVVAEMSSAQRDTTQDIQKRYRDYQELAPMEKRLRMLTGGDVPILMESDGAKSALDQRLLDPSAPDFEGSKVNLMVRKVLSHYHEHENGTQMIFMERGWNDFAVRDVTGRDSDGKVLKDADNRKVSSKVVVRQFNLARDIVEKLVADGVKPEEIAIFSNMKLDPTTARPNDPLRRVHKVTARTSKEDLAALMRSGRVRVAIGATETMGTGVNAQDWLRAMHHLDAPWTPGEFEQRNGRGWRQGNKWNTVMEYRYFTEGSHDGKRWQTLLNKVRFIHRFTEMLLNGGQGQRVLMGEGADTSEGGGTVADFESSFSAAAGDPRLQLQAVLQKDVRKLQTKKNNHLRAMNSADSGIKAAEKQIRDWTLVSQRAEKDMAAFQAWRTGPFSVTIFGKEYTKREDADEALKALPTNGTKSNRPVGKMGDFIIVQGWMGAGSTQMLWLEGPSGAERNVNASMQSIEGILRNLPGNIERAKANIEKEQASIASLRSMLDKPFSREDELQAKTESLNRIAAEIRMSPNPAPGWLRHGAPQGSLVYLRQDDGSLKAHDVMAHRWDANGYWVLVDKDGEMQPVRYENVLDETGTRMIPDQEFEEPPKIKAKAPEDGALNAAEPPDFTALEKREGVTLAREVADAAKYWAGKAAALLPKTVAKGTGKAEGVRHEQERKDSAIRAGRREPGQPLEQSERSEGTARPAQNVSIRAISEAVEFAASGSGAAHRWIEDATAPYASSGYSSTGVTVETSTDFPVALNDADAQERNAALGQYAGDIAARMAFGYGGAPDFAQDLIYQELRKGYDSEKTAIRRVFRVMLETLQGGPFSLNEEKGRRQTAHHLQQLTMQIAEDPAHARNFVTRLMRMALERRINGHIYEEDAGLFEGNELWRIRTNAALDDFLDWAFTGVWKDLKKVPKPARKKRPKTKASKPSTETMGEAAKPVKQAAPGDKPPVKPKPPTGPQKAHTVSRFVGDALRVLSGIGHIYDSMRLLLKDAKTDEQRREARQKMQQLERTVMRRILSNIEVDPGWARMVDALWATHREHLVPHVVGETAAARLAASRKLDSNQHFDLEDAALVNAALAVREAAVKAWIRDEFAGQITEIMAGKRPADKPLTLRGKEPAFANPSGPVGAFFTDARTAKEQRAGAAAKALNEILRRKMGAEMLRERMTPEGEPAALYAANPADDSLSPEEDRANVRNEGEDDNGGIQEIDPRTTLPTAIRGPAEGRAESLASTDQTLRHLRESGWYAWLDSPVLVGADTQTQLAGFEDFLRSYEPDRAGIPLESIGVRLLPREPGNGGPEKTRAEAVSDEFKFLGAGYEGAGVLDKAAGTVYLVMPPSKWGQNEGYGMKASFSLVPKGPGQWPVMKMAQNVGTITTVALKAHALNYMGGLPTEIVGTGGGALILKKPLGTPLEDADERTDDYVQQSQNIPPDAPAALRREIDRDRDTIRIVAREHGLAPLTGSNIDTMGGTWGGHVLHMDGRDYLLMDVRVGNFLKDAAGKTKIADFSIAEIPQDVITVGPPELRHAVAEARKLDAARADQALHAAEPADINTPRASAVARQAKGMLKSNFEGLASAYERTFGRVLDPDRAKELFPHYAENRASYNGAVSRPANDLVERLYERWLKEDGGPVVFTSGGSGSGKSSMVATAFKGLAPSIVMDTTLSNAETAERWVRMARDAGKLVIVAHVRRPFADAVHGVIDRAESPENGRPVPMDVTARNHIGSRVTFQELRRRFAGDKGVRFFASEYRPKGQIMPEIPAESVGEDLPSSVDEWRRMAYEILDERARQALAEGKPISEELLTSLLGSGSSGIHGGVAQGVGQQPGGVLGAAEASDSRGLNAANPPEGTPPFPPAPEAPNVGFSGDPLDLVSKGHLNNVEHNLAAIEELNEELSPLLPTDEELALLREFAAIAEPGEKVIGNPAIGNPGQTKAARDAFDVTRELYEQTILQKQSIAVENAKARELADKHRERVMRRIIEAFEKGQAPTKQLTMAGVHVHRDLWAEAMVSGDPALMREATLFSLAHTGTRSEIARALGMVRDTSMTPAQRFAEFGVEMINTPRDIEMRVEIENAPTEKQQKADVERAQETVDRARAEGDDARLKSALDALEKLKKRRTKEALLLASTKAQLEAIKKALAREGVTIDDVMAERINYRRKFGRFVMEAMGKKDATREKAIDLLVHGWKNADVARATKMKASEIHALREEVRNAPEAVINALADYLQAGGDITGFDVKALHAATPADDAGKKPLMSREEAVRRAREILHRLMPTEAEVRKWHKAKKKRPKAKPPANETPEQKRKRLNAELAEKWIERLSKDEEAADGDAEPTFAKLIQQHRANTVPGFVDKAVAFGVPEERAKVLDALIENARLERPSAIQATIDRLTAQQARTGPPDPKATPDAMRELINRHLREGVKSFQADAIRLGATPDQAKSAHDLITRQRALNQQRRKAIADGKALNRPLPDPVKKAIERLQAKLDLHTVKAGPKAKSEMQKLIAEHRKDAVPDFVDKAKALGADEGEARVLDDLMTRDRELAEFLRESRKKPVVEVDLDAEYLPFDPEDNDHVFRLARVISMASSPTVDMVREYWINSLLSGVTTLATVNNLGNMLNSAWEMGPQRAVESLLNEALEAAAKPFGKTWHNERTARLGEVKTLAKGIMPGFVNGLMMGARAFNTEVDIFDETYIRDKTDPLDEERYGGHGAIPGKLGRAVRVPGRILLMEDNFMKTLVGTMEAGVAAFRIGKAKGLSGDALQLFIQSEVATPGSLSWIHAASEAKRLMLQEKNPISDFVESLKGNAAKIRELESDAMDAAKRGDMDTARNAIRRIKARGVIRLLVSFIIPFSFVASNIYRFALRRSPFGSLAIAWKGAAALKNATLGQKKEGVEGRIRKPFLDSYPRHELVRDMAAQSIAWAVFAMLRSLVEGDDDDDKKDWLLVGSRDDTGARELQRRLYGDSNVLLKRQPDGTLKPVVHFNRIEPVGTTLSMVVDALRMTKLLGSGNQEKADKAMALSMGMISSMAYRFEDQPFMRGAANLSRFIEAAKKGDRNQDSAAEDLIAPFKDIASGFVPNFLKSGMRNWDDYRRNYRGEDTSYDFLPTSDRANKLADLYGRDVSKRGNFVERTLYPLGTEIDAPSPGDVLLEQWNRKHPDDGGIEKEKTWHPQEHTTQGYRYTDANGRRVEMTREQKAEYDTLVGQNLNRLMKRPRDGQPPLTMDAAKKAAWPTLKKFKEDVSEAREAAKAEIQRRARLAPKKTAAVIKTPDKTAVAVSVKPGDWRARFKALAMA